MSYVSRVCDDGNMSAFEALAEYYPNVVPKKNKRNIFGYIEDGD
jgi:hypothetical protein